MIDLRLDFCCACLAAMYGINYGIAAAAARNAYHLYVQLMKAEGSRLVCTLFYEPSKLDSIYLLFCSRSDLWICPDEK